MITSVKAGLLWKEGRNSTLAKGGCAPNTIVIALVIAGIILILVAGISGNRPITNPTIVVGNPTAVSPLSVPQSDVQGASGGNVQAQSAVQGESTTGLPACWDGCLLDGQCGASSIIARANPNTNTRYYYPPDHPDYVAFRAADTLGQTNFYFCDAARAEANGWQKAP